MLAEQRGGEPDAVGAGLLGDLRERQAIASLGVEDLGGDVGALHLRSPSRSWVLERP